VITVDRVRQTLLAEAAYSDRLLEAARQRDDGKGWVDEYARGRVSGIRLALRLLEETELDR